jgi:hypothetical protein
LANFRLEGEQVVRASGRYSGQVAFGSPTAKGYRQVSVGSRGGARTILLHRLKFCLAHGWLPDKVDHKDTDRSNNALVNLRAADSAGNRHNRAYQRKGRKLPRCVRAVPSGRFQARVNGEHATYLGTFDSTEAASEAVEAHLRQAHAEFYKTPRRV